MAPGIRLSGAETPAASAAERRMGVLLSVTNDRLSVHRVRTNPSTLALLHLTLFLTTASNRILMRSGFLSETDAKTLSSFACLLHVLSMVRISIYDPFCGGVQIIEISVTVTCLWVYLSARISQKQHVRTSQNFLYVLNVTVIRSTSLTTVQ